MTICKRCGAEFPSLSPEVQAKYDSKGWRAPDICPTCSAQYKANRNRPQVKTPESTLKIELQQPNNYKANAQKIAEAYSTLVEVFGGTEKLKEIRDIVGDISGWATTIYLSDKKR